MPTDLLALAQQRRVERRKDAADLQACLLRVSLIACICSIAGPSNLKRSLVLWPYWERNNNSAALGRDIARLESQASPAQKERLPSSFRLAPNCRRGTERSRG